MGFRVVFSVAPMISWNVFLDRVVQFSAIAVFIAVFVKSPRARGSSGAFLLACLKLGQEGFWEDHGEPDVGKPGRDAVPWTDAARMRTQFVRRQRPGEPAVRDAPPPARSALGQSPLLCQLVFAFDHRAVHRLATGYVAFVALMLYMFYISKRRAVRCSA